MARIEAEFGHVGMAGDYAFSKRFLKRFDRITFVQVRNGGASGKGLSPTRCTAWQRAQFARTIAKPSLACDDNGCSALTGKQRIPKLQLWPQSHSPLVVGSDSGMGVAQPLGPSQTVDSKTHCCGSRAGQAWVYLLRIGEVLEITGRERKIQVMSLRDSPYSAAAR